MNNDITQLQTVLATQGYSFTAPRKAVFAALRQAGPITPAALIELLADTIDRASVYRTIRLFEALGIIHRLQAGWKYRLELSDRFMPHHHHLYCISCGTYTEIPANNRLEEQVDALASMQGFQPTEHQIEIRGNCARCLKQKVLGQASSKI